MNNETQMVQTQKESGLWFSIDANWDPIAETQLAPLLAHCNLAI